MMAATSTEPQPLVSVFVPGKPVSVNRMYGTGSGGKRRFLTPTAINWRNAVWAASVPPRDICRTAPMPLRIRCTFYGVRGDADNYLKATLDGLKLGILVDDKHFNPVEAHIIAGGEQGCHIEIFAAETTAAEG